MFQKNIFFVICMGMTTLFLTTGFGMAREWILALAAILMVPAWLFARKYADTQLPLLCLLASVGLAVLGILAGASSPWMILGSGFSLAVWDLLLLSAALENSSPGEQSRLYESKHIQSLALALGVGLLLLFLGRPITLQTPFLLLLLLIALVLFGLDRTLGNIKKTWGRR